MSVPTFVKELIIMQPLGSLYPSGTSKFCLKERRQSFIDQVSTRNAVCARHYLVPLTFHFRPLPFPSSLWSSILGACFSSWGLFHLLVRSSGSASSTSTSSLGTAPRGEWPVEMSWTPFPFQQISTMPGLLSNESLQYTYVLGQSLTATLRQPHFVVPFLDATNVLTQSFDIGLCH